LAHLACLGVVFLLEQRASARTAAAQTQVSEATPPGTRTEIPSEASSVEGLIRIDVTVTDRSGHVASGLQRSEFKVLDNGALQQIVAFRQSDRVPARAEDQLTLILLIDTLDVPAELVAFERQQTANFLRWNSGQLTRPVAVYSLEDSGFFLITKASTDGEELARAVASDNKIDAFLLSPLLPSHERSRFRAATVDPTFNESPALTGLRALGTIATVEDSQPGRKLVLWIGPGLSESGTGPFQSRRRA